MITLITGSPGAGKTLYMVSMLAKNKEFEGRRIFVDGIPDLKIDNVEPFPEGCGIHNLHEWVKDEDYQGAIFVVDEAQRFFPPRSSNSKAPELVEFLHVHRHYAIDLYLITQMPARIDKNVRDLVGAHYHIQKNRLGGRSKLYWDYCANRKLETPMRPFTRWIKAFSIFTGLPSNIPRLSSLKPVGCGDCL